MKSKAIFLDRDGVLNHPVIRDGKSYPPARVEDVEVYPGLREQLQRLKDRGFVLIVVTNQPTWHVERRPGKPSKASMA